MPLNKNFKVEQDTLKDIRVFRDSPANETTTKRQKKQKERKKVRKKEGKYRNTYTIYLSFFSVILSLIGVIIYVAKTHDIVVNKENSKANYGYSFILTAICSGLMFCNTVVLVLGIFLGSASYESI